MSAIKASFSSLSVWLSCVRKALVSCWRVYPASCTLGTASCSPEEPLRPDVALARPVACALRLEDVPEACPPTMVQLGPVTVLLLPAGPVAPRCRSLRKVLSFAICTSRLRTSLAHIVRTSPNVFFVRTTSSFSCLVVASAVRCALRAAVREAWAVAVWRSRFVLVALRRLMDVVDVARSARTSARVVERAVLVDWARCESVR